MSWITDEPEKGKAQKDLHGTMNYIQETEPSAQIIVYKKFSQ